jgi:hypothetical protein
VADAVRKRDIGPREILSNMIRNVALHLGTPSIKINALTESVVQSIHRGLGIDTNDLSITFFPRHHIVPDRRFLTHEDYAGNGIQLLLFIGA